MRSPRFHQDTGEIRIRGRWLEPGSEELVQASQEREDALDRQAEERAEQLREERIEGGKP